MAVSPEIAAASRAVAQELSGKYGGELLAEVESALDQAGRTTAPGRFFDPVTIGTLVVTATGVGWQIYRDLKRRLESKPALEDVRAALAAELRKDGELTPFGQDVIAAVAAEVSKQGNSDGQ